MVDLWRLEPALSQLAASVSKAVDHWIALHPIPKTHAELVKEARLTLADLEGVYSKPLKEDEQ